MERTTILLVALALLAVPITVTAHTPHIVEKDYALAGPGHSGSITVGQETFHHGLLDFNIPAGHAADFEKVDIWIRDVHTGNVAAYYSFHDDDHDERSLFGGAGSALASGPMCEQTRLDIPPGATHLRITLNSLETADNFGCLPAVATAGTVTVQFVSTGLS